MGGMNVSIAPASVAVQNGNSFLQIPQNFLLQVLLSSLGMI